ncbi:alpha/beta fold hydrolase [Dactylosporangium sp. CA-152071]|uniref:alpha/beta fold hydrolase n=1 Tax=Dactylosporangium sp. CA-152071 TaxID=3239933 RepID=UPI003D8F8771
MFIDVEDGHLHAQIRGEGPDVVLLNAGAADLRMWDSTVPWLAGFARVITFDHRDMGLSSHATRPYSELDDLAAVLDAFAVDAAVLVGVSDGARRALAFAHRYPQRVRHVVAAGGAFGDFPDPSPAESAAYAVMREHFAGIIGEADIHAYAARDIGAWGAALDEPDRRLMVGLQVANTYWIRLPESLGTELDPPVKHRLHEITTPVSVVVGGHDFAATQLWAERIASRTPGATLTVIPRADHFPMLSAPDPFRRIVAAAVGGR